MEKFKDTAVLITGGGRGLGRALAEALALRGAKVVLVARSREELDATVAAIRSRGGQAYALVADLGALDPVAAVTGPATALVGPIELLVHNASDLGPVPLELLLDTSREDFERAFRVNVFAPFLLSRALIGSMILRGQGTVVFVSSDAAKEPYPRWGAYGSAKAALEQLSRVLRAETQDTGLKVLCLDPGEMDTRMHRDAVPDADPASLPSPESVAARIVEEFL